MDVGVDGDILEKVAMIVPVKKVSKHGSDDRKILIKGSKHKLISMRAKPSYKRMSALGDPKYGSGSEPHWKAGSARYPAFYKALIDEP